MDSLSFIFYEEEFVFKKINSKADTEMVSQTAISTSPYISAAHADSLD